jgi:hypothetical protein
MTHTGMAASPRPGGARLAGPGAAAGAVAALAFAVVHALFALAWGEFGARSGPSAQRRDRGPELGHM